MTAIPRSCQTPTSASVGFRTTAGPTGSTAHGSLQVRRRMSICWSPCNCLPWYYLSDSSYLSVYPTSKGVRMKCQACVFHTFPLKSFSSTIVRITCLTFTWCTTPSPPPHPRGKSHPITKKSLQSRKGLTKGPQVLLMLHV